MGYYTYYTLWTDPESALERVSTLIKEHTGYDLDYENRIKWYEWDADLCKISKEVPDVVIELYGEGEGSGDVWKAYFKNGKYAVHCQPVWEPPPYREEDLS